MILRVRVQDFEDVADRRFESRWLSRGLVAVACLQFRDEHVVVSDRQLSSSLTAELELQIVFQNQLARKHGEEEDFPLGQI